MMFIVEIDGERWRTFTPLRTKRTRLCTSVPCWMPLWLQMFSVTASQSPENRVKEP